ncbi:MAG: enoyl-CoA hydratase/isomerase family protein [Chloroflexi bacterium]|nr:enoyl-CoA hydratase/isomerase family protein [Chloroflexota bacterium]
MSHQMILTEQRGRVAIVTLNRPEVLNAMHPVMLGELYDQVQAWNQDKSVGAVIVTGAGKGFCSGADMAGWSRGSGVAQGNGQAQRAVDYEEWLTIAQNAKPIIAAINGAAVGWGLTMALVCDIRIASSAAKLSARFVRVAVTPELRSSALLPRIVGLGNAMEMMLTGRIIPAEEAARLNLVNRVVPHERLMDEAVALAEEIAFNPTENLHAVKRLVWAHINESGLDKVKERENAEFRAAMQRPAFKESVQSFMEKRQPNFHKEGMD